MGICAGVFSGIGFGLVWRNMGEEVIQLLDACSAILGLFPSLRGVDTLDCASCCDLTDLVRGDSQSGIAICTSTV